MNELIDAILFDMGGTLRSSTIPNHEIDKDKINEMILLLEGDFDALEFTQLLKKRERSYRDWAEKNNLELDEVGQWTRWMLPDRSLEKVSHLALQLSQLWRDATVKHTVFPESQEIVHVLFRRGYRLGLVSNTTSSVEVPRLLSELGIAGCFDSVILSCVVGIRKPDPSILLMAAAQMDVPPERCAYIGDQPLRDVAAARKAGFARTIILRGQKYNQDLQSGDAFSPDHSIGNLKELLEIFPPYSEKRQSLATARPVYDASLSTMWAKDNFLALGDFFLAAQRLGFPRIELNHRVNSSMLDSVDLSKYKISSIHEPCPAEISVETLKGRDWMISSPDEESRQEGVASILRSMDLATTLGVRTVVMHTGHVSLDTTLEKKLRQLFQSGLKDSVEYLETKSLMIEKRLEISAPHFEAVAKSLKELLNAAPPGIRLGLENRYHYFDIPTPDEMSKLLALAGSDFLGLIYDVGHATVNDRLGFFPGDVWLKRFGDRIFGTHLHDVIGITDHQAPGMGDVDFHGVAQYLPRQAFRTLEVLSVITPQQIKTGLNKLVETGCVTLV
jgi:putative hydrolase of the HAD superfamily